MRSIVGVSDDCLGFMAMWGRMPLPLISTCPQAQEPCMGSSGGGSQGPE